MCVCVCVCDIVTFICFFSNLKFLPCESHHVGCAWRGRHADATWMARGALRLHDGLHLGRHHAEHLQFDPVELIKATPQAAHTWECWEHGEYTILISYYSTWIKHIIPS